MSFIEYKGFARIPTKLGTFHLHVYIDQNQKEHTALVMGNVDGQKDVLVRLHSECYTGDVFGSTRCDCGEQLQKAMKMIAQKEMGILIYLRQEGRGIGLVEKLKAYQLQDKGYDTIEANLLLGHEADSRDYSIAADILQRLKVESIRIITNNREKIRALEKKGIVISSRVAIYGKCNDENHRYLQVKFDQMNHIPENDNVEVDNEDRIV